MEGKTVFVFAFRQSFNSNCRLCSFFVFFCLVFFSCGVWERRNISFISFLLVRVRNTILNMGVPSFLQKGLQKVSALYMKAISSSLILRIILMSFTMAVALACLSGLLLVDNSEDEVSAVEELWLPKNSEIAEKNELFIDDWGLQTIERVLILPNNGDPETGEEFTYMDLCYQPSSLLKKCLYYSVYDYWNYDEESLINDNDVGLTLAPPETTGQIGSLMVDRCSVTGGLEFATVDNQTVMTYLASQGMWIFMEKAGLSPSASRALAVWEKNFMKLSEEVNNDNNSPIHVYSVTGTSLEDEIQTTVEDDMVYILLCIVTILLSCPIALVLTAGPNHDWCLTGTIGWTLFLTVGMAMGVSEWARALDLKITYSGEALMVFGLVVYCSFFRVGLQWIMRNTPKSATTSHMLAYSRDIASLFLPPLTLSSISLTISLSLLCIFCPIPAIVCYLSLFFVGVLSDYLMITCFVFPFLACRLANNYDSSRTDEDDVVIYTNTYPCCCPSSSPPDSPLPLPSSGEDEEKYSLLVIDTPEADPNQETYLKKLSHGITEITPVTMLILFGLFLFIAAVLVSLLCFFFAPPQFYTYEYLPKDNYIGEYYQYEDEYGYNNNAMPVNCVIGNDIDINDPTNGPLLFALSEACNSSKWVNSTLYRDFYTSFTEFCDARASCRRTMKDGYPTASSFRTFFLIFVGDNADNQMMLGDVKLSPTGSVGQGRYGSFSTFGSLREYVDQKEFPYSFTDDIKDVHAGDSYAQAEVFPYFGSYEPSARYSFYFLLYLLGFLLLISFLFLSPKFAVVCVCGVVGCEGAFVFGVVGGIFQLDLGVLTIPVVLCSLPNVFAVIFSCCYEFNLSLSTDDDTAEGRSLCSSSSSAFFSSASIILPLSCLSQLFYLMCKSPINFYSFVLFECLYVLLLLVIWVCETLMMGLWRSERKGEEDDESGKTNLNSLS